MGDHRGTVGRAMGISFAAMVALAIGMPQTGCSKSKNDKPANKTPTKLVRKTTHGFSIDIPDSWTVVEKSTDQVVFVSPLSGTQDSFKENIKFSRIGARSSAMSVCKASTLAVGGSSSTQGLKLTRKPVHTTVNGFDACWLEVHRTTNGNTYRTYAVNVPNKSAYRITITFADATRANYDALFDTIIKSVRFEL